MNSVETQIHKWIYDIKDPRMDGFVGWDRKQKLYQIKWMVDRALDEVPKYAGEDEWLIQNK